MEIEVLEKDDNSLKFRVKGGSQSLLNLMKDEADSVSDVTFAGFALDHPLEKSSIFILRTKSKDVVKVFKQIVDKTEEDLKSAKKALTSAL